MLVLGVPLEHLVVEFALLCLEAFSETNSLKDTTHLLSSSDLC